MLRSNVTVKVNTGIRGWCLWYEIGSSEQKCSGAAPYPVAVEEEKKLRRTGNYKLGKFVIRPSSYKGRVLRGLK